MLPTESTVGDYSVNTGVSMKSMGFNFIKRGVIVPALLAAVAVALVFGASKVLPANQQSEQTTAQAVYSARQFDSFSKLKDGDYIGKLVFSDGLEKPVTFDETVGDTLVLDKGSADVWKPGAVVIKGSGSNSQLGELRHLKKGDSFTFDISGIGTYEYKITSVKSGIRADDISALAAKNGKKKTLYLCRSYNDFSSAGKTKLYTLYTAQQTGGGNG